EVIQTTGPTEGPRSPGAPSVNAGPDRSTAPGTPLQVGGFVSYTGSQPLIQWKLYSGPGTVNFSNPAATNTTATFSTEGTYPLMLSADDGIHAVAYDATVITVGQALSLTSTRSGTNLVLKWAGGTAPYSLERSDVLPAVTWTTVLTTNTQTAILPMSTGNAFFRLRSQ